MGDTTYEDRVYDFYECAYEKDASPTPGNDIVLAAEGHADSDCTASGIGCKRTRVYVNGVRRDVTTVDTVATVTTVTLDGAALVASDTTEVFHAVKAGTTGIAPDGKLTRPLIQTAQNYRATGESVKRAGCGTKMKRTFVFAAGGELSLGIDKQDNAALSAFAMAQENETWLMTVITDTSSGSAKTTILNEVKVVEYGESVTADESVRGIEQEMITFGFTPPVSYDTT